ncbi:hypothetical protein [Thermithiobacillus plumbiphilus]|uniref:Uncharacterized protein n=1 Tax=Thermithiobacillus plumbiphilus TaxID=1729899 RepID=A0ABU9DA08_9PROT
MREFTPEQKRLLEQADPQTRALLEKHGFGAFDGYDCRSESDTFAPGEDYLKAVLPEHLQRLAGKLAKK